MSSLEFDRISIRALENCSYCPRLCHFACPTAHGEASETASAWGMMSIVNMLRKGHIEPDAEAVRDLYRCTSCGRCTEFCRHGNPVAEVLESARAQLMPEGLEPPELADLQQLSPDGGAPFEVRNDVRELVERTEADAAGFGYFPGCTALRQPARRIEMTLEVLSRIAGTEFRLALDSDALCCGAWARRAGLLAEHERSQERVQTAIRGFDTVVTGCTGLRETPGGPTIVPLAEYLATHADGLTEAARTQPPRSVTLHGGCRERRPDSQASAEEAVLRAIGIEVATAHALNGEQECCGAEPVYLAISPRGAARAAEAVVAGARRTPSDLVTSSDQCARHMSESSGETVLSLLDLVLDRCSTQA